MIRIFLLLLLSIIFLSCLEESIQPVSIAYNNTLDVINFIETHGDFINTKNNPALITAEDVYNSMGSDLIIIDIRKSNEFSIGHIPQALNIAPEGIVDFFDTSNVSQYQKIILVSRSGQKAAYITSLLRIMGFNNTYSLDFGMSHWNEQFANIWEQNKTNSKYAWSYYYKKNLKREELRSNYKTPNLSFEDDSKDINENIKERIQILISNYETNSVITVNDFDDKFSIDPYFLGYTNTFVICYEHEPFHKDRKLLLWEAHNNSIKGISAFDKFGNPFIKYISLPSKLVKPFGTFLFTFGDFNSAVKLFTLPTNKDIIIYSYNGQRSAYIVAYLNLLGYNSKSIAFGAHSMMSYYYNSLGIIEAFKGKKAEIFNYRSPFSKYAFWKDDIKNYPIETGQNVNIL